MQLAKDEYNKYLALEESYWKQKAGYDWVAIGDEITRIFHSVVKGGMKRLRVNKILPPQGDWIENKGKIATAAIEFYK